MFLVVLLSFCVSGQETAAKTKRVTATGKCLQEEHMTGKQATDFARRRAKEEALRLAGVEERVWSVFGMMSSSDKHDPAFFDAWSETSFVAIDGLVSVVEESVESFWNESVGLVEKVVTVTADVDEEQQKVDPSYKIQIEGLEDAYRHMEQFSCNLRIYGSDSYLKVFYFNDEEAALIYPQGFDLGNRYEKNTVHRIPDGLNNIEAYKGEDDEYTYANLMFVVTKREYPFTASKPDAEIIMKWLFNIPADERVVEVRNILIR